MVVLDANDGIVSTASLVLGVAAYAMRPTPTYRLHEWLVCWLALCRWLPASTRPSTRRLTPNELNSSLSAALQWRGQPASGHYSARLHERIEPGGEHSSPLELIGLATNRV